MFEEKDDTILARWLSGELSSEEQLEFENSPEFLEYQQIAQGMERFNKPNFDTERLKKKVMSHLDEKQSNAGKVIALKPLYYAIAAAASVALIFGIFFSEVQYTTGVGEQLTIELPDGSSVQLNADSELSHNRFLWMNNKTVRLSGEGMFKVEKGDGFEVDTQLGTVAVLGTEFNVKSRAAHFGLTCYEGKVRFETETKKQAILTQGDALRLTKDGDLETSKTGRSFPSWMEGKSSFSNAVLEEVIRELEAQYKVSIQNDLTHDPGRFTGSFVHDDFDIALKTVFVPMGINYELQNPQLIVLKSP